MNLFTPTNFPKHNKESFKTLVHHKNVTIEYILSNSIKDGQWMLQEEDEWVLLLEGEALLIFENNIEKPLTKGDYLQISSGTKHCVKSTSSKAIWLAIHIA